jgi:hypothetical protein
MAAIGLPFWMAGAYGTSERVAAAVAAGAQGVQVGTVFALSSDSGLTDEARSLLLGRLRDGELVVRNDPRASPTGFPFKVISVDGTVSEQAVYESRPRLCDLSYLRQAYQREDGSIGYRCAAEPVHMFVKKGRVGRRHRGAEVPVQRPRRDDRHGPAPQGRVRRGPDHDPRRGPRRSARPDRPASAGVGQPPRRSPTSRRACPAAPERAAPGRARPTWHECGGGCRGSRLRAIRALFVSVVGRFVF